MTFTAIRFGIVALLLGVFVRVAGRPLPREPRMWGHLAVSGVLIRRGAASTVSSLFYRVPPVTAAQGYLLFDQRLTPLQLAGIAVTAIGVAMINVGDPRPPERTE